MKFRNEYYFLSNMYPCELSLNVNGENVIFHCAESLFQAFKCPERWREFAPLNGFEAKKLGKTVKLRPDWDKVKVDLMKKILMLKFSDPVLRQRLDALKGIEIQEENYWNDTFWGVCRGRGNNVLGILLMEIRNGQ